MFARFVWSNYAKGWLRHQLSPTLEKALEWMPGKTAIKGVVIDLSTGRMVWRNGKACDRQRPASLPLPANQ